MLVVITALVAAPVLLTIVATTLGVGLGGSPIFKAPCAAVNVPLAVIAALVTPIATLVVGK